MLFDQAVAVFQGDPRRWLSLGLLPSLPLAVLTFAFIWLHRELWIVRGWDDGVWGLSLGASLAVLAACKLRWAYQGPLIKQALGVLREEGC